MKSWGLVLEGEGDITPPAPTTAVSRAPNASQRQTAKEGAAPAYHSPPHQRTTALETAAREGPEEASHAERQRSTGKDTTLHNLTAVEATAVSLYRSIRQCRRVGEIPDGCLLFAAFPPAVVLGASPMETPTNGVSEYSTSPCLLQLFVQTALSDRSSDVRELALRTASWFHTQTKTRTRHPLPRTLLRDVALALAARGQLSPQSTPPWIRTLLREMVSKATPAGATPHVAHATPTTTSFGDSQNRCQLGHTITETVYALQSLQEDWAHLSTACYVDLLEDILDGYGRLLLPQTAPEREELNDNIPTHHSTHNRTASEFLAVDPPLPMKDSETTAVEALMCVCVLVRQHPQFGAPMRLYGVSVTEDGTASKDPDPMGVRWERLLARGCRVTGSMKVHHACMAVVLTYLLS